jgi:tetratricopeptide (TPR) repeat protein
MPLRTAPPKLRRRTAGLGRGAVAVFAAAALASVSVFPGLYDSTLTSRLAIYPALGVLLLLAGAGSIPRRALLASFAVALMPAVSILWSPVQVQAIPQIVRWASFAAMVCGTSGIARREGGGAVLKATVAAAALCAALEIVLPGDTPSGNPNRPGPLLALALVALLTGQAGLGLAEAVPAGILLAVGLIHSGFVTAWIATGASVGWFLALKKFRIPGLVPALGLTACLALFAARPHIAAGIHPSLELRAEIWRSAVGQLLEAGPLGTGAGQSRLLFDMRRDARIAELAGPEKRVDELHSDVLTPVVEQGIPGLAAILLLALLVGRSGLGRGRASLLICSGIFALYDLPLATPLGALPLAVSLGLALEGAGRAVRIRKAFLAPAAALSAAWAVIVVFGYSRMEQAREMASSGGEAGAAGLFAEAERKIPFEERAILMRATALAGSGSYIAALEETRRFNSIYPAYWRGWALQGDVAARLGRRQTADSAFMMAVRLAPAGIPELPLLALNAANTLPADSEGIALLAAQMPLASALTGPDFPEAVMEYARRAGALSAAIQSYDPVSARQLAFIAGSRLLIAQRAGIDPARVRQALEQIPAPEPGRQDRPRWDRLVASFQLPEP